MVEYHLECYTCNIENRKANDLKYMPAPRGGTMTRPYYVCLTCGRDSKLEHLAVVGDDGREILY